MTRRAARVDANQAEIVAVLRRAGFVVHPTHMVGDGFPDLAVGRGSRIWLLEVKDGSKPPSARALTPDEQAWHATWADAARAGCVCVVESVEDALAAVGAV